MTVDLERTLLNNLQRFKAFAANNLGVADLADDVVQESLIKALTTEHKLLDKEKAIPWFYQILKRTLMDIRRKQAADVKRELLWAEDQALQGAHESEACRCLNELIPTLKPEYAEVIEALDIKGEPPEKLAKQLGINIGNLKVRRHRARTQLRKRLTQTCRICAKHGCMNCTCQ